MRSRMLVTLAVAVFAVLGSLLITTAPAEAATTRTWERLARCESGGRWHLNTGNGYYGGLQFSPGTWQAYGGRKFAHNAHRATKSEQIVVAERVRRGQGWEAWPYCSRKIGVR